MCWVNGSHKFFGAYRKFCDNSQSNYSVTPISLAGGREKRSSRVSRDNRIAQWLERFAQDQKSLGLMLSTHCEMSPFHGSWVLPLQQASGLGGLLNRMAECPRRRKTYVHSIYWLISDFTLEEHSLHESTTPIAATHHNIKSRSRIARGLVQNTSAQESLELNLREMLLDLEERIAVGALGSLKVRCHPSRNEWSTGSCWLWSIRAVGWCQSSN